MKTYKSYSTHMLAYKWHIEAPDELSTFGLEQLVKSLCDYTDEPSQEELDNMLADEDWFNDLKMDTEEAYLLKYVKIDVDLVDREATLIGVKRVKDAYL